MPTTPDCAHPVLDQSLINPPLLLRTNDDTGWKLIFGQCLPLEHDIRGKLAPICVAGEHESDSVLLVIGSVHRWGAHPLHCEGGPSWYIEGKWGLVGVPDPAEGIFMLRAKLDDVGLEACSLVSRVTR